MAQNVVINGVTYSNVPEVDIPKSPSGTAKFYDTSSADISAGDVLAGKTAFGPAGSVSGSMVDNGSTSGEIQTKSGTVTIPAGYTSGGHCRDKVLRYIRLHRGKHPQRQGDPRRDRVVDDADCKPRRHVEGALHQLGGRSWLRT